MVAAEHWPDVFLQIKMITDHVGADTSLEWSSNFNSLDHGLKPHGEFKLKLNSAIVKSKDNRSEKPLIQHCWNGGNTGEPSQPK